MRIPPEGNPDAPFILVGETPGEYERKKGRLFCGPAGRELDRLLAAVKLPRQECYILNAIPDYIGKNLDDYYRETKPPKVAEHRYTRLGKRVWVSERFLDYQKELLEILNNSQGKIIIPLGRVSLLMTTGLGAITKRRGSILYSQALPGKTIIPTLHPSTIVRGNYNNKYLIAFDLGRAIEQHENPQPPVQRTYSLSPSFEETISFLERAKSKKVFAFDIECMRTEINRDTGFTDWEISCLSVATDSNFGMCIPFVEKGTDYFNPEKELAVWLKLRDILTDPNITKVIQNATFDMSFVLRKMGIFIWPVYDTMIAQNLLEPDFPKGLDFQTTLYTREPYYKDEGKQYIKFDAGTWDSFKLYSAKDSVVLLEIREKQLAELERAGLTESFEVACNLLPVLQYMEYRGLRADTRAMKTASESIARQVSELQSQLNRTAGRELNPNSPKQLVEHLYSGKGIKPYKSRKTGAATADKKALKKLAAKGIEEASIINQMRGLIKLRGTYMEMTLDTDGRIRSQLNPGVTKTGRLSSSQTIFGTGSNIQNLPYSFRRFVIADPGCLLYAPDLSQAENRIVAYISPEEKMIKAFEDGIDIHSLTGSMLANAMSYSLTPAEVKEQDKQYEKTGDSQFLSPIGTGNKTWRYWGKQSNHSLNYDVGPNTISENFELPLADAKWLKQTYYSAYPGLVAWHKRVQDKLREDMVLENLFGRKRKFRGELNKDLFLDAYAFIPQSTVGDVINRWGLLPLYREQELYRPVDLLDQVHDSIVFQMSIEHFTAEQHIDCLLALRRSLEQPIQGHSKAFTLPCEIKVGLNLGVMKGLKLTGSREEMLMEFNAVVESL